MTKIISSPQNKIFKEILSLQDNRKRKKSKEFGVEGLREIKMALENGFVPSYVCLCEEYITEEENSFLREQIFHRDLLWNFSEACFDKLLVRKKSSGLYVVFGKKEDSSLIITEKPLYLILDGVEKPANLGAILRTAEASGVTQVFLTNTKADLYNPNTIRNSLGAAFSVPTLEVEEKELQKRLLEEGVSIYSSFLSSDCVPYTDLDCTEGVALVLGSEAHGIGSFWQKNSHERMIIPMEGAVDSLNVSVATAILLFEAKRQRSTD